MGFGVSSYTSLMRRADTLQRVENDPMLAEWWIGYMRGLRRAHQGDRFGTQAEHDLRLSAATSSDSMRADTRTRTATVFDGITPTQQPPSLWLFCARLGRGCGAGLCGVWVCKPDCK